MFTVAAFPLTIKIAKLNLRGNTAIKVKKQKTTCSWIERFCAEMRIEIDAFHKTSMDTFSFSLHTNWVINNRMLQGKRQQEVTGKQRCVSFCSQTICSWLLQSSHTVKSTTMSPKSHMRASSTRRLDKTPTSPLMADRWRLFTFVWAIIFNDLSEQDYSRVILISYLISDFTNSDMLPVA